MTWRPDSAAPGWRVVRYHCPYLERGVVELWDGSFPCIAANIYLRRQAANLSWKRNTAEAKAYALLPLFRWLSSRGHSFWEDEVRRGGRVMMAFRLDLQRRITSPLNPSPDEPISRNRAREIMNELLALCDYWTQERFEEPLVKTPQTARERRAGRSRSDKWKPAAFRIRASDHSSRGEESLTVEEYERIWRLWLTDLRPVKPEILQSRIRADWPESKRREHVATNSRWKMEQAWWARNLMYWALISTTGLRRREVPGVMLKDVVHDSDTGYWVHLVDPTDGAISLTEADRKLVLASDLADFKTGSRTMFVGYEPRFADAFHTWRVWRPVLIAASGRPDHGMLLVNGPGRGGRIGSPLTAAGTVRWFDIVNDRLGPFSGDSLGGRSFFLSPHRIRHTIETMLNSRDVPLKTRQAHFGHKREETTLKYGSIYRTSYIRDLRGFGEHLARAGDDLL
jgi:hypothetical protein